VHLREPIAGLSRVFGEAAAIGAGRQERHPAQHCAHRVQDRQRQQCEKAKQGFHKRLEWKGRRVMNYLQGDIKKFC
jgi:hypothetical protein